MLLIEMKKWCLKLNISHSGRYKVIKNLTPTNDLLKLNGSLFLVEYRLL